MNDWTEARSLRDLGELTALYLEGKAGHPLYDDNVDDETIGIAPYLISYNRHGFLTSSSQPGLSLQDGYRQRAYVNGFASKLVALSIYRLCLCTELIVLLFPPGYDGGYQIPVTVESFHPFTWVGGGTMHEIDYMIAGGAIVHRPLIEELSAAWSVEVIDLCWGRNDYLWPLLESVLLGSAGDWDRYDASPDPSLGLGVEFVGPV